MERSDAMSEGSTYTWDALMKFRTAKPFRPFFITFKSGLVADVLDALAFGGHEDRLVVIHPRTGVRSFRMSDVTDVRLMDAEEMAQRLDLIARMRKRA